MNVPVFSFYEVPTPITEYSVLESKDVAHPLGGSQVRGSISTVFLQLVSRPLSCVQVSYSLAKKIPLPPGLKDSLEGLSA